MKKSQSCLENIQPLQIEQSAESREQSAEHRAQSTEHREQRQSVMKATHTF
jgi:hypothetical protein